MYEIVKGTIDHLDREHIRNGDDHWVDSDGNLRGAKSGQVISVV